MSQEELSTHWLGVTQLMEAAAAGNAHQVHHLIECSDPLARDARGLTALMFAAMRGNGDCILALLPVSDHTAVCNMGFTALDCASSPEAAAFLRALIEKKELDALLTPKGDNEEPKKARKGGRL